MINILLSSTRDSTKSQYNTYIKLWELFCNRNHVNMFHAPVTVGLQFLSELYHDTKTHRAYNCINTARSALSSILITEGVPFGENIYVKKFMKGVFNLRPPVPRYLETWDIDVVVKYLQTLGPAQRLSLLDLSRKLVMLFLIITAQRAQVVTKLHLDKMKLGTDSVTFYLENRDLKQGRIGYRPEPVCIKAFSDRRLCFVLYLKHYLKRTMDIRDKHRLLVLTTTKPCVPVSRDTVSRWVKCIMEKAGIDTSVFKPGSTRMASTSKAKQEGVPVDEILSKGGWSRETTFSRFYKRPVRKSDSFVQAVLPKTKK